MSQSVWVKLGNDRSPNGEFLLPVGRCYDGPLYNLQSWGMDGGSGDKQALKRKEGSGPQRQQDAKEWAA